MYEFSFVLPWFEAYGLRKTPKEGDIGLEIELEIDKPWHNEGRLANWVVDGDGSLRGHGYEFILRGPKPIDKLTDCLDEFQKAVKDYKIKKSPRTSVHVHFNMHKYKFPQILNFGLGYWLVEDWLLPYCGPSRAGNMFCLSNSSSNQLPIEIAKWLKAKEGFPNWTNENQFKYSSFNFCPLRNLGSVEIRTMRGVYDPQIIHTWVGELNNLKDAMTAYENPQELLKDYVEKPKANWIADIFSRDFRREVNQLHQNNLWQNKMDKAFFDLVQIANAIPKWNIGPKEPRRPLLDADGRILPEAGAVWHRMGINRGFWRRPNGDAIDGNIIDDPLLERERDQPPAQAAINLNVANPWRVVNVDDIVLEPDLPNQPEPAANVNPPEPFEEPEEWEEFNIEALDDLDDGF